MIMAEDMINIIKNSLEYNEEEGVSVYTGGPKGKRSIVTSAVIPKNEKDTDALFKQILFNLLIINSTIKHWKRVTNILFSNYVEFNKELIKFMRDAFNIPDNIQDQQLVRDLAYRLAVISWQEFQEEIDSLEDLEWLSYLEISEELFTIEITFSDSEPLYGILVTLSTLGKLLKPNPFIVDIQSFIGKNAEETSFLSFIFTTLNLQI
jgi:hypothetical protein